MLNKTTIAAIAEQVSTAQNEVRQIEPITSREPDFDLESAYAVAELVHQQKISRGATPIGRKAGFTNARLWAEYDVDAPIWAHIYDTTVVALQDNAATFSIEGLVEPKIEPEIVLHLAKPVTAGASPAEIVDAIDWIAHGIEIVQSHYPGWVFKAADTVAASGLHGGLIVGPPVSIAEIGHDPATILEQFTVDLSCDGQLVDSGSGANVLGNPLLAIRHLAEILGNRSHLKAGEMITTGTVTGAFPVSAGQTWQTRLAGIPLADLSIRITG